MIYSKSCEYAVRALCYLAQTSNGSPARGQEIAKAEGLRAPILGKVLQELVRKGLLESRRGPQGGFLLARRAELITLRDIVAAIDGLDHFLECVVGLGVCSDESPCPLHDTWKGLQTQLMKNIEATTLADMASAVARKKELLQPQKRSRR